MFLFTKRRRSLDVIPQRIRRILDLTVEMTVGEDEPRRRSRRYTRFLPALLAPWDDGHPIVDDVCFALTRNISDAGIGLILPKPFDSAELCLGLMIVEGSTGEPCFFLGTGKHLSPLGGGYWSLGVNLTDCASETCPEKLAALRALAAQLTPGASSTASR